MRLRARTAFVLLTALLVCVTGVGAQSSGEYDVKAAYLYNFAKFVEWPPEAFPAPDAPFAICVLGQDPSAGHSTTSSRANASRTGRWSFAG